MTLRRITRNRRLSSEEAAQYREVREQVAEELPDLITRHHERLATFEQLEDLLKQLKAAREEQGLSLSDLTRLTGMDRSALSKLETGQRLNPTIETLVRYAEAVGKRLMISLANYPGSFPADWSRSGKHSGTEAERRKMNYAKGALPMDIAHVKLQYDRLERYYSVALKTKDPISFLDLSHALRIWVDMKAFIDTLAKERGLTFGLANPTTSKEVKRVLRGSKYTYLPLASGVESPGIKIKGVRAINRALSPEEIKKLYEAGPPTVQPSRLSFSEWLASGIYEVPSSDKKHPHLRISREILIKRVANILGASHPAGTEAADAAENRFDPYVLDLHEMLLADGYPATYYQLLEIAKDILAGIKTLFGWQTNALTK